MKIKRPLVNSLYEEEIEDNIEPEQVPLERPSFTFNKPVETPKEEVKPLDVPIKKVLTQEPPRQYISTREAQNAYLNEKKEAPKPEPKPEIKPVIEYPETPIRSSKELDLEPLPKYAVPAEVMPQKVKVLKKEVVEEVSPDQLDFEIQPRNITFKQRLEFFKLYFERRQELLEISMLWKNPSLPFNIVSVMVVAVLLFIGGILEFDKIPLKIPLFYNHVEKSWEQTDKSTIFIMGIILLATEGILINLIMKIFKSDRRLALTLSWMITFINVLVVIASLQIYSLIT